MTISVFLVIAIHPTRAGPTSPSLDGTGQAGCGHSTNSCAGPISTSNPNDIVIVYAMEGLDLQTSCTFSVSDTAGLSWSLRASAAGRNDGSTNGYRDQIGEFWAKSSGVLSSDIITESISGCASTQYGGEYNGFQAFAVSGANFNAPFDPSTIPGSANGYSNTPSVAVSTSNSNDMIISAAQQSSYGTLTPGSGFTGITANTEFETVSSPVTNFSVTWGDSATWYWEMIADAITGQASPPDFSFQPLPLTVQLSYSSATAASIVIPVTVFSQGGFSGTVNLSAQASCGGGPACSVTPASASVNLVNSGSSTAQFTFSIVVGPNDRNNEYILSYYDSFVVTGTSGGLAHQASTQPLVCLPPYDQQSNNWSGYVMDFNCNPYNSPVYFASAAWNVPSVSEPGYLACWYQDCSIVPWVGLMHDTHGSTGIVQIGTVSNVNCPITGCATHYSAVWEFFPSPGPLLTALLPWEYPSPLGPGCRGVNQWVRGRSVPSVTALTSFALAR